MINNKYQILVTGGMGFIGKEVVKKLLKNDIGTIIILDNLIEKIHGHDAVPYDFKDKRIKFIKGDVSSRKDIEPLLLISDVVLHLAAETGTGQSMYEIEHYNKINISATALMLDILSNNNHHVKKIVIASSRAIYGEGKYKCSEHGIVYPKPRLQKDMENKDFNVKCPSCNRNSEVMATDEESLIHPISFYGITKQTQEAIVMTLCPNIGIAPVSLRYQNVYGPGQSLQNPYTGILSIFSNLIRSGKNISIFEDGTESRDFVFIEDVAEITSMAIFSDYANNEIINVGSGVPMTVLDVANKLKLLFKSDIKINIKGNFRMGDIRHNYADITKLKKIFNYSPSTDFTLGIKKFVEWVKTENVYPDLYNKSIDEMKGRGLYK